MQAATSSKGINLKLMIPLAGFMHLCTCAGYLATCTFFFLQDCENNGKIAKFHILILYSIANHMHISKELILSVAGYFGRVTISRQRESWICHLIIRNPIWRQYTPLFSEPICCQRNAVHLTSCTAQLPPKCNEHNAAQLSLRAAVEHGAWIYFSALQIVCVLSYCVCLSVLYLIGVNSLVCELDGGQQQCVNPGHPRVRLSPSAIHRCLVFLPVSLLPFPPPFKFLLWFL